MNTLSNSVFRINFMSDLSTLLSETIFYKMSQSMNIPVFFQRCLKWVQNVSEEILSYVEVYSSTLTITTL